MYKIARGERWLRDTGVYVLKFWKIPARTLTFSDLNHTPEVTVKMHQSSGALVFLEHTPTNGTQRTSSASERDFFIFPSSCSSAVCESRFKRSFSSSELAKSALYFRLLWMSVTNNTTTRHCAYLSGAKVAVQNDPLKYRLRPVNTCFEMSKFHQ